jgi:putative methylase
LEQYTIPGNLAAEILNLAFLSNDIKNKRVLDLGCGSGKLAIGSALLEAREVIAVDIDEEVLNIAIENLKIVEKLTDQKFNNRIKFIKKDVSELDEKVDTVIQNPPFGIQKLHADRLFLKKALECGDKIYSLHRSYERTREFLTNFIKDNKGKVEKIISFKFRIPYMFKFHERPSVNYDVDLFIISKV